MDIEGARPRRPARNQPRRPSRGAAWPSACSGSAWVGRPSPLVPQLGGRAGATTPPTHGRRRVDHRLRRPPRPPTEAADRRRRRAAGSPRGSRSRAYQLYQRRRTCRSATTSAPWSRSSPNRTWPTPRRSVGLLGREAPQRGRLGADAERSARRSPATSTRCCRRRTTSSRRSSPRTVDSIGQLAAPTGRPAGLDRHRRGPQRHGARRPDGRDRPRPSCWSTTRPTR